MRGRAPKRVARASLKRRHSNRASAEHRGRWLQQTTTQLARCRTSAELLDLTYEAIHTGLGFDRVGVLLLDTAGGALVPRIGTDARGGKFYPQGRSEPLGEGASYSRLLSDPRMGLEGPGYVYRADATAETAPAERPHLDGEPRGNLLVALRTAERALGVISVDNLATGRPIGPGDAPPLVAFASVMATALENITLLEERGQRIATLDTDLRHRMEELHWMQEATRQVNAAPTLHDVLDVVYDSIHEGLDYDRVGVNLFDHATGVFEEVVGTDDAGRKIWTNRVVTLAEDSPIWRFPGIAALLRGAAFYYTEAAYAECPPELRHLFDGEPTHNVMIPLRSGEQVTGMISVDNLTSGRPIVPDQIDLLLALAHQVSTAIERARLRERERAEGARLAASEESLRTVMATMACGVIVVTPAGDIADANEAAHQILGQNLDALRGRPIFAVLQATAREDGAALPISERPVSIALRTRQPQHGVVMDATLPNGNHCALQVDAVPLLDPQGTLLRLVVSFIDITTRKVAEETLTRQALHDSLTGLPNRVLLAERLGQALLVAQRTGASLALLLLDLDHFKEVNDTLGHAVGDLLLQEVAARLRTALRTSDTVARLGGDEFAVLLPTGDSVGASRVAETILAGLEAPVTVEEHRFTVEASIGVAASPAQGSDAATLLRHADMAMYVAKRGHLGYAVYTGAMDDKPPTSSRLALLSDLRESLAQQHLLLYYQPKVQVATARLSGVEALLRWPHPRHGFIPPDQFIPLAEQTGIMAPLTHWVLETGLRQCRAWTSQGQPLNVAINLSARSLHDQQMPQTIAALLGQYDLAPGQLTLEITESALMIDPSRALEVLTRMADLGVRLSIDDFGTGYSSLSYLKRLPVHEVKIDKSFVLALSSDPKDAAIVHAVIVLAHALDLEVVAEGVEDQATWDLLVTWGCDSVQGYYLCRPIPAEEVYPWIAVSSWR